MAVRLRLLVLALALAPLTAGGCRCGAPEPTPLPGEISVLSLLGEMAGLDHLARLPPARFVAGQQASTDRRSRAPEDGDSWFANDDFVTDTQANLVRVEERPEGGGRLYVLLDAAGPGAVLRIWSATPAGTLRIHIDEDPRPALEAPMAALLSGEIAPFVAPLGEVTARGYTLYFPFPYRKRCRVTVDSIVSPDPFSGAPVAKLYYQIGYRSYGAEEASGLRSYSAAELARAEPTVARVAAELARGAGDDSRRGSGPPPGRTAVAVARARVEAGRPSVTTAAAPAGGGAVTALTLVTAERDPDKLRSTTLAIAFDGEETVRAPLIDFFGTGPAWSPYRSLPFTVGADDTLRSRFPMPFRRQVVISLSRAAPGAVDIGGTITVDPRPFTDRSLLFHARWRPRQSLRTRPFHDWHVATLTGTGHLVGTVLNVENPPGTAWWGEGDEKLYVDGERFPSLFGTGTEDYFGYAWSTPEIFTHPYHAQTRVSGTGFAGPFSMNRFHVSDPVPFARSLRFDLEVWHWSDTTLDADATLYWYARPGGTDDFPAP